MKQYESEAEPQGETYAQLLSWLAARFDQAQVIRRLDLPLDRSATEVVNQIEPDVIDKKLCSEWPGTMLNGHEAEVVRFHLNGKSLRVLLQSAHGLFDWQQPELPEDLAVLRSDGEAILLTIAHEGLWVLTLTDRELSLLQVEAPLVYATHTRLAAAAEASDLPPPLFPRTGMSLFVESAQEAVSLVLRQHGIVPDFKTQAHQGNLWLSQSFTWNRQSHRIEIYEDSVVMHQGDRLFEPYMTQELESDQAQIQGFCERLDRYLGGGDWGVRTRTDQSGFLGGCSRRSVWIARNGDVTKHWDQMSKNKDQILAARLNWGGKKTSMPKVRHTVGFPAELNEGSPAVRLPLPSFLVLLVSSDEEGCFLERITQEGEACGDTWHPNREEAIAQAEYEFGDQLGPWISVPDGEDPLEFMVTKSP